LSAVQLRNGKPVEYSLGKSKALAKMGTVEMRTKKSSCEICTSYHMATRALANLSPEGAKRPRAIN